MNLQESIRRILREEVNSVNMKTIQSELSNILGASNFKNGNRVEFKSNIGSFDSSFDIIIDRLDQKTLDFINKFMSEKGWFPTNIGLVDFKQHIYSSNFQNYIGQEDVQIGYEANTGKQIVLKQSKIYHVTPNIFVNNILNNGIILKSESKLSNHPERIYLYLNKDNSKDMVTTLWNSLSKERQQTIEDYYVLEIDVTQIPNHKFYHDPASIITFDAIYTNQSIPKSAIKVVDKINTNDLKIYDKDEVLTPEQERQKREERKRKEEERKKKEKEDSVKDLEFEKNYEQIPDDIKNMSIDDLFESKKERKFLNSSNLFKKTIRRILREENKKPGLLRAIEEDGLFQVIQDTGLSMEQIILKYDNLPREVFERYIKDFLNEEGYHQTDGAVQLGYEVEIQTNVYIDHFYMKGDKVTVETRRYNDYNEQTEGYIESLSNLTDEEIFNIVDDMTSWSNQNDL